MSTHTCDLDIDGIPEQANIVHIVPGLAHESLIYISVLCDAGCRVHYGESMCSVYYNVKIVWKESIELRTRL